MAKSETYGRSLAGVLSLFIIALLTIGADQLSKYLIQANMDLGQSIPAEGLFRITYTTNTGGAFGILANQGFLLAMTAIIAITVLVLFLRYLPPGSTLLKVGLGLDLGGAIGNLIDRIRSGEVTDFIDFGAWPVFNLADSAIVIGTITIVFYLIFGVRKKAV
jgi:signal peptidase II